MRSGAWLAAYPALRTLLPDARLAPFACDAFGDLWVHGPAGVAKLTTETCELDPAVSDPTRWASAILSDPDLEAGKSFLEDWAARHGGLPAGTRLTPRMPFALGGGYGDDNLVAMALGEILAFRSDFAIQTHGLYDGFRVLLDTTA